MALLLRILALGITAAALVALALWLAPWPRGEVPPPGQSSFVRAQGQGLVRAGAPFRFEAVGFGNDYSLALGQYGFSLADSRHHSERDFERVAEIGFNAVRFAFNGTWWRDDPRAFWDWLDRNIGWAEAHGLVLVLDLHVPIGGNWLDASLVPDFTIWTDPAVGAFNVALWQAIAERYRDEPTIAAYDILNEPVTADATGDQWRQLAAEMVAAIRAADPNHLLIVGPVYGTEGEYRPLGPGDRFLIDDPNVMYDLHFYEPIAFTHQTAGWLANPIPDGGRYPDPDVLIATGTQALLPDARIAGPTLPAGDSNWRRYESDWTEVADPRAVAALPTATLRAGARGRVLFDEIEVFEQDPDTGTIRRVLHAPLAASDLADWWDWRDTDPAAGTARFERVTTDGVTDRASLLIDGAAGPEGYLGWSSDLHWFRVTPGFRYRIAGQMKGTGVAYGPSGEAPGHIGLSLDIYGLSGDGDSGFLPRDRSYLAYLVDDLTAFGRDNAVPMSVMEFGTIRATFDDPNKGGAAWISDMLDLLAARGLSFSLWAYHDPAMGLYLSDTERRPARPNRGLIDAVETSFAGRQP